MNNEELLFVNNNRKVVEAAEALIQKHTNGDRLIDLTVSDGDIPAELIMKISTSLSEKNIEFAGELQDIINELNLEFDSIQIVIPE